MARIFLLSALLALLAAAFSCSSKGAADANGDTPTEAYKRLYLAVKAKDVAAIKGAVTKRTIDFAYAAARQYGKPEDSMLENGMTATTFSNELPAIRDERVKDNMGALEVWNTRENKWEDLPFMIEDGKWKLAIGDAFKGVYHSPGKGRDQIEKEAANAVNGSEPHDRSTNAAPTASTK